MRIVPLPADSVRQGRPLPFALRDASGLLLMPRGSVVSTPHQLQLLLSRPLFVEEQESEAYQRAVASKVDEMIRADAPLGQIAKVRPDAPVQSSPTPRAPEGPADWPDIQMWLHQLLREPKAEFFEAKLSRVMHDAQAHVDRDADLTLLVLIQNASRDLQQYSANHALLTSIVCGLAAQQLPAWPAGAKTALTRAALTMNIAMTSLQDELTLQEDPPSPLQRRLINDHSARGMQQLQKLGVTDPLWLAAVAHHHDAVPGPLSERAPGEQLARLIQRTDMFAARMSPRKGRPPLSAAAAAQAAYLDEQNQPDEAGAAIIKALGIYPPGSYVRLACGEIAVVLRRGRRANEAKVASVVSKTGTPLGVPALRDTRLPAHHIKGAVAPHEVKVRLSLEKLLKLA